MAGIASGALQGRSAAVRDTADQQQQQQAASQKMLLERLKLQADQDKEIRDRAFTYGSELQKVIQNPDNLKYFQDNGLLDQHQREVQGALNVASGQASPRTWRPQFAFSDDPNAGQSPTPATPAGGFGGTGIPQPQTAGSPGAPAGGTGGGRASPADSLAQAGGLIPRLTGSSPAPTSGPFGPVGPPQGGVTMTPAAAPTAPAARRQFPLTEAQQITERTTAENEAAGAETRRAAPVRERLDAKKFNLDVAKQQLDSYFKDADFRKQVGQDAYAGASGLYEKFLTAALDLAKESAKGPGGGNAASILRSILHTPSGLGTVENQAAFKAYVQANRKALTTGTGLTDKNVDDILADPSVFAPPMDANGNPIAPTAAAPTGAPARPASRGGGAPPLPPTTGPAAGATPAEVDAAMGARGQILGRGATSNRGAVAPPRAAAANPALQGNKQAIQQIGQMTPDAQAAANAGFAALQAAGVPFTVNSTFRTHGQQAGLVKQKQAGKNPNPVAPVGSSTHEAGLALDLSSGTGRQEDLAGVLAPLGWKWGGAADPVHFTFVGTRGGQTSQASRGGGSRAPIETTGTQQPPPGGGSPNTPPLDIGGAAAEVGIRTPTQAPPLANPYQAGTFGREVFDKLTTGERTPDELIRLYAHSPQDQSLIQQIAEQVKRQQAGALFDKLPVPSLEGARLPTQTGIESMGSLMYTEPGVGTPNVTTEPIESSPNVGRQVIQREAPAAPVAAAPPTRAAPKKPFQMAPGRSDSGGGGTLTPAPRGPLQAPAVRIFPDRPVPKVGINISAPPPPASNQQMSRQERQPIGGNLARNLPQGSALAKILNKPIDPGSLFGRFLSSVNDSLQGQGPVYDEAIKTLKSVAGPFGLLYDAARPPDTAKRITKYLDAMEKTRASDLYKIPELRRDTTFQFLKPWMQRMGYSTGDQVLAAYKWWNELDDRLRRPPYSLTEKQIMEHAPTILESARSGRKPFRYTFRAGTPTNRVLVPEILSGPERKMSLQEGARPLEQAREQTPADPYLAPPPGMEPGPPAFRPRSR